MSCGVVLLLCFRVVRTGDQGLKARVVAWWCCSCTSCTLASHQSCRWVTLLVLGQGVTSGVTSLCELCMLLLHAAAASMNRTGPSIIPATRIRL